MRNFARLPIAALAVAAMLSLGGCVQQPTVTPTPVPSTKPLFASDDAALAAATKAYAKYLAVSDLIAQEGGAHPERLSPFVTPEWLAHETASSERLASSGNHQEGSTKFDGARLQRFEQGTDGVPTVAIYVCLDLTSAQLFSQFNEDVTASGARARFPFEAIFRGASENKRTLVLDENLPWSGADFC